VRCSLISSAPHVSGFAEISVKRQGSSRAAARNVQPSSTLYAPLGCVRSPGHDRPLVLLAAGAGITPLVSMLRHALHTEPQRPVVLVQSASRPEGLAFADEFRVLQRRHDSFRWVPAVSRVEAAPEFYPGRIDGGLLGVAVPGLAHSVICLCGPAEMISTTRDLLESSGVPKAQVRFELFEAAVAAAGADAPPPELPPADDSAPIVTFSRSGAAIPAPAGQTLLDIAERSGVEIPSLCRAGVCGTCRTRVTRATHATDDDDDETPRATCRVAPTRTDCAIDA
jgi:ferredoxin-NADP reductase